MAVGERWERNEYNGFGRIVSCRGGEGMNPDNDGGEEREEKVVEGEREGVV